jgi:hypothetical protein
MFLLEPHESVSKQLAKRVSLGIKKAVKRGIFAMALSAHADTVFRPAQPSYPCSRPERLDRTSHPKSGAMMSCERHRLVGAGFVFG